MISKTKKNIKTIFITGATGQVGSYLLKIFLKNDYKVYALARSKDNKNARDRVLDILKFWDKNVLLKKSNNLIVLEGDITKKNLGLDKPNVDLLKREVEEIFHCAAETKFNAPLKEIRKINVEGTRNVLELAVKCSKHGRLKKVNHLSTAYVCGDYKGVFKEDDLDVGQGFSSTYQQSKYEAEILIEEYRRKGLWIDIFRPPLVIGEAKTGKTITFQQGVYQLLHVLNLKIFNYFPVKGFFINIGFVDEICKAIFIISSESLLQNQNYHIFNNKSLPFELMLDISNKFLNFKKPKLIFLKDFFINNPTSAQKMLLKNNILLFNNDVKLDSIITNKILKKYGFEFSNLKIGIFLKLLKYCIREGFLKSYE